MTLIILTMGIAKVAARAPCDVFDPCVRGSAWDLRVRPAAAGNLGTWTSGKLEIWGPENPEIWDPNNKKNRKSLNLNPFCLKCRQGLD